MNTVVITTGGLGTRLLTYTKVNPKAMLPIFDSGNDKNSEPLLRPLLEIIFENLYDLGFRRFCFIVGSQGKFSIFNHFKSDLKYENLLKERNFFTDRKFLKIIKRIQKKINNCDIKWIVQSTPKGFGDALLKSKKFVGNRTFLLHTGDLYFPEYGFLEDIINTYKISKSSAAVILQKVKESKGYGIAEIRKENNLNFVLNVEEKPKMPKSNLAILPIYIFNKKIFDSLLKTKLGHNCELQVTDAIANLIKDKEKVLAYNFGKKIWFDVGTPQNYFKAIQYSFKNHN